METRQIGEQKLFTVSSLFQNGKTWSATQSWLAFLKMVELKALLYFNWLSLERQDWKGCSESAGFSSER